MRRGILFVALIVVAACTRTPPEPEPAPVSVPPMPTVRPTAGVLTATSAQAPYAPPPPSRCIAKWPDTAPTIPPNASGASCPPEPKEPKEATAVKINQAIEFQDVAVDGGKLKIVAELATSAQDVERGLMYRRSMADTEGMFFRLGRRIDHTFWMHNTCIALDMMFVDTDGVIVGIVEGAAPLTDSIRSCGCESSYVLEVNGGWSRKHGVKPGQRITIPFSAR